MHCRDQRPVYSAVLTTVKHSINLNIYTEHGLIMYIMYIYTHASSTVYFMTSLLHHWKKYIEESEKLAAART